MKEERTNAVQPSFNKIIKSKERWQVCALGNAINALRTGLNPRTHFKLNTEDAKGYYVTVRELNGFDFSVDNKTDRINEAAIKRINERSNLQIGDILYSGTGTIGRTAIVNDLPTWWNIKEGVYAITPTENLNSKFLVYQTMSDMFVKQVLSKASGTTIRSIPMKELVKVKIALPPLSEQQQIVDYLDIAFAKIDQMKANASKALDEAKALFQSALTEAMTPKGGWTQMTIGELGELKNGVNYAQNESGYNIHILGVGNFGDVFCIDNTTSLPVISLNDEPNEEYFLKDEDIVFVRSNGNKQLVGRSILIYTHNTPTLFSGFCIRFRKKYSRLDATYLLHYLKMPATRKALTGNGTNISNLNQKILKRLPIAFPSLTEQQAIVTHLDTISEKVKTLQANYTQIVAECDALKQAILKQIFE